MENLSTKIRKFRSWIESLIKVEQFSRRAISFIPLTAQLSARSLCNFHIMGVACYHIKGNFISHVLIRFHSLRFSDFNCHAWRCWTFCKSRNTRAQIAHHRYRLHLGLVLVCLGTWRLVSPNPNRNLYFASQFRPAGGGGGRGFG